jgi:hypothetical protein
MLIFMVMANSSEPFIHEMCTMLQELQPRYEPSKHAVNQWRTTYVQWSRIYMYVPMYTISRVRIYKQNLSCNTCIKMTSWLKLSAPHKWHILTHKFKLPSGYFHSSAPSLPQRWGAMCNGPVFTVPGMGLYQLRWKLLWNCTWWPIIKSAFLAHKFNLPTCTMSAPVSGDENHRQVSSFWDT